MYNQSNNRNFINHTMTNYFEQVHQALSQLDTGIMAQVVETLLKTNRRGRRIYLFGNGGSAATASHFANDLAKGCIVAGHNRFRAISLTDSVALMTAWANDTSYDNIFAEQLRGHVEPEDVVIGISGSGNSPNVLKGIEVGRDGGAITIGFCGYGGGKLRAMSDLAVSTDCTIMEQVEDIHMSLCHNLTTTLRMALSLDETPIRLEQALPTRVV